MKKTILAVALLAIFSTAAMAQVPYMTWDQFVPKHHNLYLPSFPRVLTVCAQYCSYVSTATAYAYIATQTADATHNWVVILMPNATDDGGAVPSFVTKASFGAVVPTNYAGSVSPAGPATTATALAANGANCTGTSLAAGVDASGAAEGCSLVKVYDGVGNTAGKPATCTAASSTVIHAYRDTQAHQDCTCDATNTWSCS